MLCLSAEAVGAGAAVVSAGAAAAVVSAGLAAAAVVVEAVEPPEQAPAVAISDNASIIGRVFFAVFI